MELIVSTAVLLMIASFVVANFRAGQQNSELRAVARQVSDGISAARIMTLGGQIVADPAAPGTKKFPDGGFGVAMVDLTLDPTNSNRLVLFGDFDSDGINNGTSELIANGLVSLSKVDFTEFCALEASTVGSSIPCDSSWVSLGHSLTIIFSAPGVTQATYSATGITPTYVGGVFKHQKTGRQGYFYVSLASGLIFSQEL